MKKLLASKTQKQFWTLNSMYPESAAYNLFSVFKLNNSLNISLFKQALGIVVDRHEALRSQFQFDNKDIYLNILDKIEINLKEYKINQEYDGNEIHEDIEIEVNSPFDLSKGPLYRFSIFHFKNQVSVLSLVFHHIIIDVRSEGVFSKELSIAYNALINAKTPQFDSEPIQYSEYIDEITEWYNSEEYKTKLNGFISDYPDANQKIELPYNTSNLNNIEKDTATGIFFELDDNLTTKISEFASVNNSNPYRVLLSAYSIFLQRISNQENITIGLPLTNRTRSISKNTFGCFINALPLEINFTDKVSISDILVQIDNKLKQNLDRQEIPFTDLVKSSSDSNKSNRNPYFQTGFAFKPPMQLSLEGIEAKPLKVLKNGAQLDLFYTFWAENSHTVGYVEYAPELFSKKTIIDWIDNFKILLTNMLQNPDKLVFELDILTEKDIESWIKLNDTNIAYEDSICLHQKFENQVLKSPDSIAILWDDKEISYSELNREANRLSHLLIEKGVTIGSVVAYSLERCPELIISILAIHKAGACYLPFDTKAPIDRLESIIEDANPILVITKSDSDNHIQSIGLEKIYVDDILNKQVHSNVSNPDLNIGSNELAYILYTSGSTGKPKGVMIKHHSVMNKIGWMQYKYSTDNTDTLILKTPVTFDVSVWELFWWFFNGSKLLLLPPGGEKIPETIISEVEEKGVTVIIFVPSMFTSFVTYLEAMEESYKLASLKLIIQIGEALSPQLVKDFNQLRTDSFNPIMLNTYGPTEATVAVSYYDCPEKGEIDKVFIGKPIFNTQLYVVNKLNKIQPIGVPGELLITGENLSPGYLHRPELNANRFIEIIDINKNKQRAYKTGDLSFLDKNGELDFMGRIDNQIKLRGYRIELGEIESRIFEFSEITNCAVLVHDASGSNPQLIGYITTGKERDSLATELKDFLIDKLPEYMIPAHFIILQEMPLTSSGKINRKVLPKPSISTAKIDQSPKNSIQEILIETFKIILEVEKVGVNSNFFELGGTSLMAPMIVISLKKNYNINIKTLNIFEYPTIDALSRFISETSSEDYSSNELKSNKKKTNHKLDRDIAVIGMSGCFPGADNLDEYWKNLLNGEIKIKRFSKEQLIEKGVSGELLDNPDYVYANGIIDRGDMFDSSFFGVTPREADFMDPQHRLFLEVCYEALEDGGYVSGNKPQNIGVFAGSGMNSYLFKSLLQHPSALRDLGEFQTMINNDKDFITTRVSYKLNLTGPSYDIQTACSTSLVAVHTACQNLLNEECDMALAGGAYIHTPRGNGYMFKSGGILSSTGYCKPFDKDANGTVLGEGAGVVLLKRLSDAINDKDNILAIIKSSAINNDGANKVGYMAPSVEGQASVIRKAQEQANIPSESISYIETHGTGTKLGDPIEISSLKKVFQSKDKHCALGAVKANIGHLDAAAGIAGLIKIILALKNKQIPPLGNFSDYNPELEIENSPFYAPEKADFWKKNNFPRRAAVSAFGIGGTNAHCILEEYSAKNEKSSTNNSIQLLPISTKNSKSLSLQSDKLLQFITDADVSISDIAYTLQTARNKFKHRKLFFGKNGSEILSNKSAIGNQVIENPATVFMLTGQGSQYANMGKDLYNEFSVFRSTFNEANEILLKEFDFNIVELLFNSSDLEQINDTYYAQPLIVAIQYALVKLLESFGITPDVLIGHSIGELTAACVSGVFSFKDTIILAAHRGRIMHKQERGSMISVNLPEAELIKYLPDNLELALINAPGFCVVSGSNIEISNFKNILNQKRPDIQATILKTSHAFHSKYMEPAIEPFKELVAKINRNSIKIPFISNSDGQFISDEQAKSPDYWAAHIRKVVDFNAGVKTLLEKESVFLEIGPGSMLTSLLSQQVTEKVYKAIPTMRSPKKVENDVQTLLFAIGQFWVNGGEIDWSVMHKSTARKVSIPTYAFDRKRHWIDTKKYFSFDIAQDNNNEEAYISADISNISEEEFDRSGFSQEYISPENDIQSKLLKIWEDLLGLKSIGIIDNLFDLGGHSLLASQIVNKLNELYKTNLPLETLFNYPTVKELSLVVEQNKNSTIEIKIDKIEGDTNLPVSQDQIRLWILAQFDNNPAYNIPFTYSIKGEIDNEIFKESLNEVFNRHAILRGRIETIDVNPSLKLSPKNQFTIKYINLSEIDIENRTKELNIILKDDIRKVFDLENDSLYRAYLIKISDKETIFHITIHHIIFDGWSWGIFVKELNQIYTSLSNGEKISLPEPAYQYYEYSDWRIKHAHNADNSKTINYWKTKLENHPTQINFPYDYNRKKKSSGLGEREHFIIDNNLNLKLKTLSKKENVTEFTTYISALSILLNNYSRDKDICIGIPTANRGNTIFENIIGFFVNTIVFRSNIDVDNNFLAYLSESKKTIQEAIEHQDLPFEKLVELIQPTRKLNVNPIFQIMFSWLNAPRPPIEFPGIESTRYSTTEGVSPLDITFYLWEDNGCIEGEIEFNSDLLSRNTIKRLKDNFIVLLENISTTPKSKISDLECISETELKDLKQYNLTSFETSKKLIHELIREQALEVPTQTAIVCGNEEINYKELNLLSDRIANYLLKKGIKENDVVGICFSRSIPLVASTLAVLKCGAAYLPIDPDLPTDRLKYMLDDSKTKLVLSEEKLSHLFHQVTDTSIIFYDKIKDELYSAPNNTPSCNISGEGLAYLIYTSGSTGKPKGVKIPHRAVVNFLESMAIEPGLNRNDTLLAVTTHSFDISVLELFLPLIKGAKIILAQENENKNGKKLIRLIEDYNVTLLQATPVTWNILLYNKWAGKQDLKALCGGEPISVSLIESLLPKVSELWNMYGPTETTVWSTCNRITSSAPPVLVGKPINNTSIYILSETNKKLPIGSSGEVCIGGQGVALGYHKRDELTSEKFILDNNNELIYKTGDLGRIKSNGQLELFGRIDNQIKLRGFRIEPGEIETLLCKIPGVKEAVVKIHNFTELDERLIAFLNTEEDFSVDKDQINSILKETLPEYMVPSAYQIFKEFPRTPNGKIDQKALVYDTNLSQTIDADKHFHVPAEKKLEKELIELWKKVLRINNIGIEDNFFDIGGNSITLIQVSAETNELIGKEIDIIYYFEHPTIKSFSDYISEKEGENSNSEINDTAQANRNRLQQMGQRRKR